MHTFEPLLVIDSFWETDLRNVIQNVSQAVLGEDRLLQVYKFNETASTCIDGYNKGSIWTSNHCSRCSSHKLKSISHNTVNYMISLTGKIRVLYRNTNGLRSSIDLVFDRAWMLLTTVKVSDKIRKRSRTFYNIYKCNADDLWFPTGLYPNSYSGKS